MAISRRSALKLLSAAGPLYAMRPSLWLECPTMTASELVFHEIDRGEVEDDAVGLMARRGQVLVELAARHRVKLAADRHDRDLAVAVRRQSEPLHTHPPGLSAP